MKMSNSYIFYTEKLNDENRQVFNRIEFYVSVVLRQYYYHETEDLLNAVFDSIITAQENGKPVSDVIGDDLALFCENICEEFKTASLLKQFFYKLNKVAVIVLIFSVIQLIDKESTILKSLLLYVPVLLFATYANDYLFSRWFRSYFRKHSITFSIKSIKVVDFASYIGLIIFSELMGPTPDYVLNPWIPFGISLAFIIFYGLINRKELSSIQKNRIDSDILFRDTQMKTHLKSIEEFYNKENRRRDRKDEPRLSETQFLKHLIHQQKSTRKWFIIIVAILLLPLTISYIAAIIAENRALFDTVIAIALCVVIASCFAFFLVQFALNQSNKIIAAVRFILDHDLSFVNEKEKILKIWTEEN